ncbi:MAG: hypothetical protein NDJ92_13010 [Thermoanaerobaculia bacterium]|nr:hypothetical protein [Thermoanaerobaculia bacterium]
MIVAGIIATVLAGWAAIGMRRDLTPVAWMPAWFVVGAALMSGVAIVLTPFGVSLPVASAVAALLALCAASLRLRGTTRSSDDSGAARAHLIDLLPLTAVAPFVWKSAIVPLWSWDHFAIWGVKARWFAATGSLATAFLDDPGFGRSNPGYPNGYPGLLAVLSFGEEIVARDVKIVHILFGLALVVMVRESIRAMTGNVTIAAVAAALVATSPLFWDTESLGLAEVPLMATTLTAIVLSVAPGQGRFNCVVAGALLGWTAWIKTEGFALSACLLLALVLGGAIRSSDRIRFSASWVAVALAAIGVGRTLPAGTSFFSGDYLARAGARMPEFHAILAPIVAELLRVEWLGMWIVSFVIVVRRASLSRRAGTALAAAVAVQLTLYVAVYLFTYLDPAKHIDASFFRIAAAMLPLAIVAAGALLDGNRAPEAGASGSDGAN